MNICQSDAIPAPEDISTEQLTEILRSETPSTYKVPMSITELRLTPDKSGKEAVVCDVAVHPAFFRKMEALNTFRDFLINIVFEALDTKYNVQINLESWIILKNRKCMGKLVKHRIQNRDVKTVYESYQNPTPEHRKMIQELDGGKSTPAPSSSSSKKPKLITEVFRSTTSTAAKPTGADSRVNLPPNVGKSVTSIETREPQYRLFKNHSTLIAEFFMPDVAWQSEISLDLGRDRLVLEARRTGYLFDSFFPHNIDHHISSANFDNGSHVSARTKIRRKFFFTYTYWSYSYISGANRQNAYRYRLIKSFAERGEKTWNRKHLILDTNYNEREFAQFWPATIKILSMKYR